MHYLNLKYLQFVNKFKATKSSTINQFALLSSGSESIEADDQNECGKVFDQQFMVNIFFCLKSDST